MGNRFFYVSLCTMLILAVLFTGCSKQNAENKNPPEETEKTGNSLQNGSSNGVPNNIVNEKDSTVQQKPEKKYDVKVNEKYTVKGRCQIYAEPFEHFELALYKDTALPGEVYDLKEINGCFGLVAFKDKTGWVPLWYLADNGQQITDIRDCEMIVQTKCSFYLTPVEEIVSEVMLEPGQVVHVISECGGWYSVEISSYEENCGGDKWVRKDKLSQYDEWFANEGYILKGTAIYDKQGNRLEVLEEGRNPVLIMGEDNNRYHIRGMGGWQGYIDKDVFIPNQFDGMRKSTAQYLITRYSGAQSIELLDLAGKSCGSISGQGIERFIDIIEGCELQPYPDGLTGGEVMGELVLTYGDGTEKLMLGSIYLYPKDWSDRLFYDHYMVFPDESKSSGIIGLFR